MAICWTGPREVSACIDCGQRISPNEKQCESCLLKNWVGDQAFHEEYERS